MVTNPAEMFEVTKFGKTVGYVKAPVNDTLQRKDMLSLNQFQYKFRKDDVTIYPATEFVHASLEDSTSRTEEIINIFTNQEDFDAEELVLTAKNAGCKYVVLTTRHHEGFSLYDTCGLSDFLPILL